MLRNDSHCLAARLQHRVREHTHQADLAAAVHQSNRSSHQLRTQLLSGSAGFRVTAGMFAAVQTNSVHAAILGSRSQHMGKTGSTIPPVREVKSESRFKLITAGY